MYIGICMCIYVVVNNCIYHNINSLRWHLNDDRAEHTCLFKLTLREKSIRCPWSQIRA